MKDINKIIEKEIKNMSFEYTNLQKADIKFAIKQILIEINNKQIDLTNLNN